MNVYRKLQVSEGAREKDERGKASMKLKDKKLKVQPSLSFKLFSLCFLCPFRPFSFFLALFPFNKKISLLVFFHPDAKNEGYVCLKSSEAPEIIDGAKEEGNFQMCQCGFNYILI